MIAGLGRRRRWSEPTAVLVVDSMVQLVNAEKRRRTTNQCRKKGRRGEKKEELEDLESGRIMFTTFLSASSCEHPAATS